MTPEQVTRARELVARNKTVREIAAALKVPRATVSRTLRKASQKPQPKGPRSGPRKARPIKP
jgi:hypothetical protein